MDRHVEDIGESVVGKARESTYMIGDNPESGESWTCMPVCPEKNEI